MSDLAAAAPVPAAHSRLEHVPVGMFAIVMGLAGLTLATMRLEHVGGSAHALMARQRRERAATTHAARALGTWWRDACSVRARVSVQDARHIGR